MQRWTGGRTTAAVLLTAATLLGLATTPAPADAAGPNRYDVYSCRGPLGEPVGTSAWRASTANAASGDVVTADGCAGGGALELSLASGRPFAPATRGSLTFFAPPGTHVDSWEVLRSFEVAPENVAPPYDYAAALTERKAGGGDLVQGCSSSLTAPLGCLSAGSPTDPDDPANRAERTGAPVYDALELWVGCVAAVCDAPPVGPPARVRLYRSRVEVHDLSAPQTPELSGSLVEQETVSGTATIVVAAADSGGGIAKTTFSVDDGAVEQTSAPAGQAGTCREPYTVLQPCPTEVARIFTLDTTRLADGPHTASGTVVDAAGNVTGWGPVAFTVRQPLPPVDTRAPVEEPREPTTPTTPTTPEQPPAGNGEPAVRKPRLTLDRAAVVRRGGRAARLTGALRTAAGQPIAGARLTVAAQTLGAVTPRARTLPVVTTNAKGRFALTVKSRGAERVTVAFAPADGAADTVTAQATVREPASLTVARSRARLRRGQRVELRGTLRGTGAAAKGAVVELQAVVSGEWRTVGTVRADARGRYAWRYRFVSVTRDTIFSFRAVVRSTPGWPWRELRSKRLNVRVDAVS
jgi:hypothetical protein